MKIIVDSGATKGDWRLVSRDGKVVGGYSARGTNVSAMSFATIEEILNEAALALVPEESDRQKVSEIYLYTAGVVTADIRKSLVSAFSSLFPAASAEVEDDLTGTARAVCGRRPGIAVILGTGSNSCLFDGEKIVRKINSAGFILGDEGGAACLGKLFLADFLKGLVPDDVAADFRSRYQSDYATIVRNVYRSEGSPSGYLGGFAPFIMEHYQDPYVKELVDGNFRSFMRRSLKQLETEKYPVGVAGGFGCALKDIVVRIAKEEGVKIASFTPSPIDGLVAYYAEA